MNMLFSYDTLVFKSLEAMLQDLGLYIAEFGNRIISFLEILPLSNDPELRKVDKKLIAEINETFGEFIYASVRRIKKSLDKEFKLLTNKLCSYIPKKSQREEVKNWEKSYHLSHQKGQSLDLLSVKEEITQFILEVLKPAIILDEISPTLIKLDELDQPVSPQTKQETISTMEIGIIDYEEDKNKEYEPLPNHTKSVDSNYQLLLIEEVDEELEGGFKSQERTFDLKFEKIPLKLKSNFYLKKIFLNFLKLKKIAI